MCMQQQKATSKDLRLWSKYRTSEATVGTTSPKKGVKSVQFNLYEEITQTWLPIPYIGYNKRCCGTWYHHIHNLWFSHWSACLKLLKLNVSLLLRHLLLSPLLAYLFTLKKSDIHVFLIQYNMRGECKFMFLNTNILKAKLTLKALILLRAYVILLLYTALTLSLTS